MHREDSVRSMSGEGNGSVGIATRSGSSGRHGFSLLELMMVLAIIVTVIALSVPAINRSFARQALDKSADRLRVAMGKARVSAIKEGDVYAVFVEPNGRWFDVAPFNSAKEQIAKSRSRSGDSSERSASNFEDNMLPNGILFAEGDVFVNSRAMGAQNQVKSAGKVSGNLQQILFYPDGTSQDAKIMLVNETGGIVEVQLRGLTGLAKAVRLKERR